MATPNTATTTALIILILRDNTPKEAREQTTEVDT